MRVVTNAAQASQAHRRRVSSKVLSIAAALAVAGMANSASAQVVWDGGGGADNNWSNAANWNAPFLGNYEPGENDNAVLNNGDTILVNQPGEMANIFAIGSEAGGTGTLQMVGGDLSVLDFDVGQVTGGSGTLQLEGGAISTRGRLFRFGVAPGTSGDLQMSGGTINVVTEAFDLFLLGDNGDSVGNTISGGTLTTGEILGVGFQPTSTADVTISGDAEINVGFNVEIGLERSTTSQANGTVNMTGGTVNVTGGAGDFVVGFRGIGALNLSGGTINTVDNLVLAVAGAFTNDAGQTFAASHGTVNQSGGTINSQIALLGEGGDAVYNMTGGTLNANLSVEVGRFSQSAVFTQSGGSTVNAGSREFFGDTVGLIVGDSGRGTYNLTENASFTTTGNVMVGAFGVGNGDINQSGNSTLNADGMIVAKRGTGVYNQSGGTANFTNDVFLGDFDNTNATYVISGGELNIGGNLNVAAALASNAAENPEEPTGDNGPQGQALNVRAVFNVQGSAASINIGGDLLANPADKGDVRSGEGRDNLSTLIFDLDSGGVSTTFVDGVADLDGAMIDINDLAGYLAANGAATLIDAAGGFANGGRGWVLTQGNGEGFTLAPEDQPFYDLNILPNGSGGEMLVATLIPEPTALAGLLGGVGLLLRRRRGSRA